MELRRRRFLHLAAGAVALPFAPHVARAQTYPTRPVRIVVGFPAGGGADITARLMGRWLSERLGQPFIVDNRPGAASNIGAEAVVRAAADGYTLFLVTSTNAYNATLYDKINFNLIRDIAPIAGLTRDFLVMVVNPSVPVKTAPEFIAYAKANPGKLNMASAGVGGGQHVAGELFMAMTGVQMNHVPYRGSAPALTDLMSGQVQVSFEIMTASISYIKAGSLRALAVTSATRLDALPEVPSVSEFVPGYEISNFRGVGGPKNTPAEIIDKLNREINAGLADPKIKTRFADLGAVVLPMSPADFGKLIADETEKWATVIRAAGIKVE
jgi:tripartite-type tricarboxylate transporter receptor subunit TctC